MTSQIQRSIKMIVLAGFLLAPHLASAYYDPGLQRWINRDPIGEEGGYHLLRFVNNAPVANTDAQGLFGVEDHGADYMEEDNCWYKSSIPPWSYWRHFRKDMEKIERELGRAVWSCDLRRFRSRVHMGQDNIGHRKYLNRPWPIGHWIDSLFCPRKCPDNNPTEAAKTFREKWEKAWNDNGCEPTLPEQRSHLPGDPAPAEPETLSWR
jgi:hypothetical protein